MKKRLISLLLSMAVLLTMSACSDEFDEYEDYADFDETEQYDESDQYESMESEEEQGSDWYSLEEQTAFFAQQRDAWIADTEYADERYCVAVADFMNNGKLQLVVSNSGGTGLYTYNRFYELDDAGNVQEIATSFTEFDSQPDLIDEGEITIFGDETGAYYYIVHDMLKESPASYVNTTGSLCMSEGYIQYTALARQSLTYTAEGEEPDSVAEDFNETGITAEEYEDFAWNYYTDQGMDEYTITLIWFDVDSIRNADEAQAQELLIQSYLGD